MARHDRADTVQKYLIYALQVSLVIAAISAGLTGRWTVLFSSALIFGLTFLPLMFERRYDIDLPIEFELVIVVIIYASLFLGELHGYYTRFFWWDAVLHTGSAMAFGFVGFLIIYVLDKRSTIKASPKWIALFAFCFALAIGAIWEVVEFSLDQLFGWNMQASGLVDTMWDLIVDGVGALIATIAGYFYLQTKKGTLIRRLIRKFFMNNPKLA